uniref:Carbonic anhydrase n=1 Tax=Caenorhabditis japonica TaxID=281687 RepID=A0A8R1E268_CAEJA
MNKILRGVIKFRQTIREDLVKQFEDIKNNPKPTAVMFTCMDSRMLPTRFTQSQVGDMFVVRNAGNMIPDAPNYGAFSEVSVNTEPAALELAVKRGASGICGCPKNFDVASPMDHWVRRNGFNSVKRLNERLHRGPSLMKYDSEVSPSQSFEAMIDPMDKLPVEDKLSQINVLQQLINICSHEFLKEYLESGRLHIHGMWFDIYKGEDYLFSKDKKRFVVIDENTVTDLLAELNSRYPLPEDKDGAVAFAQSN